MKAPTKAPAADDAPADEGMIVHKLAKPVMSFGESFTEIKFREPTGADIVAAGNPVILDMASDPPRVLHDERKMAAMMARLSGLSPMAIGNMGPQDWSSCAWLLTSFFVPTPGTV